MTHMSSLRVASSASLSPQVEKNWLWRKWRWNQIFLLWLQSEYTFQYPHFLSHTKEKQLYSTSCAQMVRMRSLNSSHIFFPILTSNLIHLIMDFHKIIGQFYTSIQQYLEVLDTLPKNHITLKIYLLCIDFNGKKQTETTPVDRRGWLCG